MPDPAVISMRAVSKTFRTAKGDLRALDGVDLELRPGEALAVVGESGSGKSTLARLMVGLDRPTSGEIGFHGVDVVTDRRRALELLREKASIVFQDPYASLD